VRFRKKYVKHKDDVWLNMMAGAIGGLLGSWTMNQFQAAISKLQSRQPAQEEPATAKAADRMSEAATGRHLTPDQKKTAEPLVHYGFGTAVGAIYGLLAAKSPVANAGAGTVYGSTVWLLADEIGVPAAGLSKPPAETPWPQHLQALAAHLIYGLTAEGIRRLVVA
jgi:putative membrane protein